MSLPSQCRGTCSVPVLATLFLSLLSPAARAAELPGAAFGIGAGVAGSGTTIAVPFLAIDSSQLLPDYPTPYVSARLRLGSGMMIEPVVSVVTGSGTRMQRSTSSGVSADAPVSGLDASVGLLLRPRLAHRGMTELYFLTSAELYLGSESEDSKDPGQRRSWRQTRGMVTGGLSINHWVQRWLSLSADLGILHAGYSWIHLTEGDVESAYQGWQAGIDPSGRIAAHIFW